MSQKQPVETTIEFLASQQDSLPSASEETAASEPVANSEMPQFAPPSVTGEIGRLGKYRIQKELGRGGMGAVYLAFDERLQRQIALKVMLPKFAANANAKDRFLREARAAARISSDHVVNIHEADEIDGTPYIALQLLQGYPLDEYLKKKGSPSLPQIMRIGKEMAIGLAAAHKLGLVHRDIKPGNVWLEAPNGRVKILDFGLAKPVEGTESVELTAMGALVGTPAYMAPEQGRGQTLDGRADLFSLGCVLYRLCTGKLPFDRPTLMSILIAIATEEPKPVRELNPNVPEPLAKLIHQLLSKNADDRPANAQAVVKEFDGIIAPIQKPGEVIPHVIYAPMAVSVQQISPFADIDTATDSKTAEAHADESKSPPRKFPAILVGSLLFALIAIVLAGFIVIKITNKDGTVTEVKVPKDSKIEVDGKTVTKKLAVANDPERAAAEYVLSIGGTVHVNGQIQDSKLAAELPKGAFELTGVDLNGNKLVTDADLVRFKNSRNLQVLLLGNTDVTDAGMVNFADCKKLTKLALDSTQVGDVGLTHFKDCKDLTSLILTNSKTTDAGLAYFKDCKALTGLYVATEFVTDMGLAHFKNCKNLLGIYLSFAPISDAGLAHFKDCEQLNLLYLDNTRISDASVAQIIKFKKLTTLWIKRTKISAAKFEELKKAFPKCRIESDFGTYEPLDPDRKAAEWVLSIGGRTRVNGSLQDVKAAADLPKEAFNLTGVDLFENKQVTDAGLANFAGCKNLKYLWLTDNGERVTDAGLAHFKDCKDLIYLFLQSNTQVSDAGMAYFENCKDLTHLNLGHTQVTDAGLAKFKDCKKLKQLLVTGRITDAGLLHFKDCEGLEMLYLRGSQVSDASVAQILQFKRLTELNLLKTKISAAKFEELKKTFPQCKIVSDYGTHEPSSTFKNSIGMEFVKVPKGTSWLGGGPGKPGETKVVIEQDFFLGKYEVTQEEWESVMGQSPSHFSRTGAGKDAVRDILDADLKRFPVESVSWDDCQLFIKRLNEKEKESGWVYRLPKEAEWEYACRGGPVDKVDSAYDFYFAKPTNKLLPGQANFDQNDADKPLKRSSKVASYEPNSLGLHDMHGNVWEWCEDTAKGSDGASQRVNRGGCWRYGTEYCRAVGRGVNPPSDRNSYLGLRLARVPIGPAVAVPTTTDADRKAAQFMQVHGITLDAFKEWAAKLPKGYQPSWISLRSSSEVRFDAVATLIPKSREWKLIFVKSDDDKPYYDLKGTHRLARIGNYKVGDKFDYFTLGIFDNQDGQESSYWYGNSDFIGGKIVEGFKLEREHNGVKERWLPYSLTAYNSGDGIVYQLMSCWQPDAVCEWHPELTADELATKIAEYRKKGWQPHIVSVHSNREDVKFLAVFTENKTNLTWDFTPNLSVTDYETQLIERKSKGQRSRCVGSHTTAGKVSYTVVWDRVPASK